EVAAQDETEQREPGQADCGVSPIIRPCCFFAREFSFVLRIWHRSSRRHVLRKMRGDEQIELLVLKDRLGFRAPRQSEESARLRSRYENESNNKRTSCPN